MCIKNCIFLITFFFYFSVNALSQVVTLIPSGSSYKYLDNGSNQGTAWRAAGFNDISWSTGNAHFGYGDGDETTTVNYGSDTSNKYITTYFRKSFNITDPGLFASFKLKVVRDDGAIVYLNGKRVAVSNMPTSGINYLTPAKTDVTGSNEAKYFGFNISPTLFVAGNNTLAIEIHQFNGISDDLSFDLKLEGTPVSGCGTPMSLAASAISSSNALVSWSVVPGSTSYTIQYRPSGTVSWLSAVAISNSIVLSGLWSNTLYEYQVQAVCISVGAFSAISTFNTMTGVDSLINSNSSWKYLDDGSNQGTLWQATSFNDALWAAGNAELGYGDGDEATTVGFGPNASVKYITTYFRKNFFVSNPSLFATLNLNVVRDDGIVAYLNGTEIYRNSMPSGSISNTTLATATISGSGETAWNSVALSPTSLLPGNNVLAIEIHQVGANNPDISLNARLYASTIPPVANITRGAYLQKVTSNSITVRWRTDIACNSKVAYGTSLSYGNDVVDAALTTEHIVTIPNLSPATKYFYSVGTTYQVIQGDVKNNFYTAPPTGATTPVRIWTTGDFGNGSAAQAAVRDAYAAYTGSTPTNLWTWLGDNAYSNGLDAEFQNYVFSVYPDQLKSFPLYPAPGNHDYGSASYQGASSLTTNFPYFSIFSVPQAGEAGGVASGTPKYYSYNYANIHFISLDSYGALNNAGSPMYNWLNNDLSANTQRWTIVYFHHPPFSKGTHNSDTESELVNMRTNIVPLLESYRVDLVLSGHSHTNERSYFIKGHFGVANTFNATMKVSNATNTFTKTSPFDGTIYAVCGTSGQGSTVTSPGYPMSCMYFNNNTSNCSLVIDVSGDNLDCKYLTSSGTIADQFTITKVGASEMNPSTAGDRSFFVYYENQNITLNYYLKENSTVKVDLLNILGENILSFASIPAFQLKGFYQFELPFSTDTLRHGVYFLRININGRIQLKKLVV